MRFVLTGFVLLVFFVGVLVSSCQSPEVKAAVGKDSVGHSCMQVPVRFGGGDSTVAQVIAGGDTTRSGMVYIPGGTFDMGGDNNQASQDEYPKHRVRVSPFWMDATEVTNAQFKKFLKATGYVTTAERKPDWEVLKKSLPPGTPRPPDSVMVAASLVFKQTGGPVDLNDYSQWWS